MINSISLQLLPESELVKQRAGDVMPEIGVRSQRRHQPSLSIQTDQQFQFQEMADKTGAISTLIFD
jgi:hypothetical protein